MSENVTTVDVDAADAVEIPIVKVTTADEFRAVAKTYGVPVGERGRVPKKNLFDALLPLIIAGKIKFVETEFLSLADARGVVKGEKKIKPHVSYRINYHTLNKNGKPMPGVQLMLTQNEIKSYLPNVRGMVNIAFATMAVALHRAKDGALLADLNKYVVTSVEKIETMPGGDVQTMTDQTDTEDTDAQSNAETTNAMPEDEDTREAVSNAGSDTETPTDAVVVGAGDLVPA